MAKPKLAFIDHSFHKKTKSSDFLRNIFEESFEIREYWDESWQGGASVSAEEINKNDYAFYLQVMSSFSELKKIRIPIIWAPMYDGMKFNYFYWKAISKFDIKVLSFSKKVVGWLEKFSIPSLYVQYYYLKPERALGNPGNHILFWYRGGIDFEDIKRIIDPEQIDSFIFLEIPDKEGKTVNISDEDLNKFKINRMVESFLPKEKYMELLKSCSVFIAPRKKEGIGAFTEALSMGKCVIAYDDAVHNEYISSGVDGFLFNEKSKIIDLSRTKEISDAAWNRAVVGYERWLKDVEKITPFMIEPLATKSGSFSILFWNILYRFSGLATRLIYYSKKIVGV